MCRIKTFCAENPLFVQVGLFRDYLCKALFNETFKYENPLVVNKMLEEANPKPSDLVTRDMTVGEVVRKYPETIPVLLDHGLHCVGCNVSYWETLEQGARGHGMTEEQISEMIEDINDSLNLEKPVNGLSLSKEAVGKLKEVQLSQNKHGFGLKVEVIKGGCSGNQYLMELKKGPSEGDKVIEQDGVKIFLDPDSAKFLDGSQIHYINSLQGAGFKIKNPNVAKSCACGQSFS